MNTSLTYLNSPEGDRVEAALTLLAESPEDSPPRAPTHFVVLLDLSDSMTENNKLTHVKHCLTLLLDFLTEEDMLSIITFASDARVCLNRMTTSPENIASIRATIDGFTTDGMTNMSAAFLEIPSVIAPSDTRKTGLLLLTDGYANRGVASTSTLIELVRGIHARFPSISFDCLAYGHEHNADLLKRIAEITTGGYNVVTNVEDAASGLADSLGSLVSCSFMNVCVDVPLGTRIIGCHEYKSGVVRIGDVRANMKTVVLLDLPREHSLRVRGISIPDATPCEWEVLDTMYCEGAEYLEIELLRLRYECSALFAEMRAERWPSAVLQEKVAAFAAKVGDAKFDGNPVADMLREEAVSLTNALTGNASHTTLLQHETFVANGRGQTQQIRESSQEEPENPAVLSTIFSPYHTQTQREMVQLMRTRSAGPNT